MKIALPVSGGQLCSHFGHCERFYLYDVEQDSTEVLRVSSLNAPPHEPGLLPTLLGDVGVDVVIAGGMGDKARDMFYQKGIQVVVGVSSGESPEDIIQQYLTGSLDTGPNVCDH
ncbi:MAG: NifB/NifX family molybdenum-iron cluster-binding protein [Bacillota bacterium]